MNDSDTITDDSVKQNQRKNTRKLKAYKKSNELSRWSINSCVRIEASDIPGTSGYRITVISNQSIARSRATLSKFVRRTITIKKHRKIRKSRSYIDF